MKTGLIIILFSVICAYIFEANINYKQLQVINKQHEIINGYRYLLIEKEKQNDTLRWFNQMKIKY